MAMLAKVRRMFYRERLSKREISRRTGLARSTIDRWLNERPAVIEPKYRARQVETKIDWKGLGKTDAMDLVNTFNPRSSECHQYRNEYSPASIARKP